MAKLLGNDIVTQEEFDAFIAATIPAIKSQLSKNAKKLNFALILSISTAVVMILTSLFVVLH